MWCETQSDPMPKPGDGPEYHYDLLAWKIRNVYFADHCQSYMRIHINGPRSIATGRHA